ncbi:hypothetical protein RE628_11225 [Paenibacillus sp. D2_2]|uniref:hypothetical protein n=1 Tax=Paenibacillus sp. D2_2 TaxID=3073092 RepID=UPI002814F3A0|nr:hypothetical protein [Paenibacillus sp. D2_2]WMT42798.1 hypothetical protein RE628_11225 [Paenibacillus sp. D2_2]
MNIDANKLEKDVLKIFFDNVESIQDHVMTQQVAQVAARMAVIAVTRVLSNPELYQLESQKDSAIEQ